MEIQTTCLCEEDLDFQSLCMHGFWTLKLPVSPLLGTLVFVLFLWRSCEEAYHIHERGFESFEAKAVA
jgi:hypothetical protein